MPAMHRLAATSIASRSTKSSANAQRCWATFSSSGCARRQNFSSTQSIQQQSHDETDLFQRYSRKSIESKSIKRGWPLVTFPDAGAARGNMDADLSGTKRAHHEKEIKSSREIPEIVGERVYLRGYTTSVRKAGKKLAFVQLTDTWIHNIVQLKVERNPAPSSENGEVESTSSTSATQSSRAWAILDQLRPHTPVEVYGVIARREGDPPTEHLVEDQHVGRIRRTKHYEIVVDDIKILNEFSSQQVVKHGVNFPPEQRHLQFRTDNKLRHRIRQRSLAMAQCRKRFFIDGFDEIETPLLFKSTPEGAREFVVPTRQKGMAYALPQSPQQYKQLLMASGFHKYFQFAKCFRDEDLRTDRQPEFTQLDLEMSFAGPDEVKSQLQRLFNDTLRNTFDVTYPPPLAVPFSEKKIYQGLWIKPRPKEGEQPAEPPKSKFIPPEIPEITYTNAMRYYGSDKPDLRIPGYIMQVDQWLPQNLVSMMTSLETPIVEAVSLRLARPDAATSREFVQSFMESPEGQTYTNNPDGMPGIAVIDSTKPLQGLAAFGHEAAEKIIQELGLEEGDILIAQSRPNKPFHGASTTPLGNLRVDLYKAASKLRLVKPLRTYGFHPLWVVDFPLFSPLTAEDGDAKHTSASGICSTHHPFTSPIPDMSNLAKLQTNPLEVVGDHFDLVINGVEVGGGSRRIHDPHMQRYILRDILKLPEARINDFSHLLTALKDGCPPHVGFALGFDRLMAILTKSDTVRDVIAFPKTGAGEDRFVGSPSPLTDEQLRTYHLAVRSDDAPAAVDAAAATEVKISEKA